VFGPLGQQYLEQDDPELFESKVKYILENDVSSMDLRFTEDEYTQSGQPLKVILMLFRIESFKFVNRKPCLLFF
jgi:hypothetical protein